MSLNKQKGQYRNKEWLRQRYWDERHSLYEIARISGACYVTIWTWKTLAQLQEMSGSPIEVETKRIVYDVV